MQEMREQAQPAAIEYPQDNETINLGSYSLRIRAPQDAEKVELSLDNGDWQPCRQSEGRFWYDWDCAEAGEHEAVAKIQLHNGEQLIRTRRFEAVREGFEPQRQHPRQHHPKRPEPRRLDILPVAQFQVQMPSRPENLARLSQLLDQRQISFKGLMTVSLAESICVHFVTDRMEGLRQALTDAGFQVLENEALKVQLPNEPGMMNRLMKALAQHEVQLHCLYGTTDGGSSACVIVSAQKPEQAQRALEAARQALAAS